MPEYAAALSDAAHGAARARQSAAPPLAPPPEFLHAVVLLQARAAATGVRGAITDEFEAALCAYVGDLKAGGLGPVDTLLRVKGVLRAAALTSPLVDQAVTRCIKAYYRTA